MTNTNSTFLLTDPYFNSSTGMWQRTGVYVDDQGNALTNTILFWAADISGIEQADNWEKAVAGGTFGATLGFTISLALSGNPLAATLSGIGGFLLGMTDPMRQFFADSIANGFTEIYNDSPFSDPNETLVFLDGSFLTLTLPEDENFDQYYTIKLGTAAHDALHAPGEVDVREFIAADGGNDTILSGGEGNITIDGGAGSDTLSYANLSEGIDIDLGIGNAYLTANVVNGVPSGPAKDVFDNIENVIGTDYADRIVGDKQNNILIGGEGDDALEGDSGADIYVFSGTWGDDEVGDSGAGDQLVLDGKRIASASLVADENGDYELLDYGVEHDDANHTLTISKGSNTVELANWQDGDYGITLVWFWQKGSSY